MSKNYPSFRLKHLTRSFAFVLAILFVMNGTTSRAAVPVFARHVVDTSVCSSTITTFSIDNLLHFTDGDLTGTDTISILRGPYLVSGAGATGSVSATTMVASGAGTLSPTGTTFGGYTSTDYGIRSFTIQVSDGTGYDTVQINVHLVQTTTPAISGNYYSVHVGEQISLTGTDYSGSYDRRGTCTYTWSIAPGTNATVSATGVVTGTNVGNETVTYTVGNACPAGVATRAIAISTNVAPTLNSVSGASSLIPGTTYVINGSGFNATPGNYTVYFGAVKATAVTATSGTLTVTVPVGATNAPIYVLDNSSQLSSFIYPAAKPVFDSTSFIGTTYTNTNPFMPSVVYNINNVNTPAGGAYSVEFGDIDGDGKSDLVVVSTGVDSILVYRNNSTYGRLNSTSYEAPKAFKTTAGPISCRLADLDGDGKLDVVTAGAAAARVTVLRNTSTSGNLSFAQRVDLVCAGILPDEIAIADFNKDGRPDIAVVMTGVRDTATVRGFIPNDDQKHGRLIVFRNLYNYSATAPLSASSFDTAITIKMYDTFSAPISVAAGDLDGDGLSDLVVSDHHKRELNLFRNMSTTGGSIQFAGATTASTAFGAGTLAATNTNVNPVTHVILGPPNTGDYDYTTHLTGYPEQVKIGDLDNDGKADIAVAVTDSDLLAYNQYNKIVVFHNNSSVGSLTVGAQDASLNTGGITPVALTIADINGDGKLDIINSNAGSGSISIHKNTGTASTYSFGTPVLKGLSGSQGPVCPAVGDIDGNNIPDIAVACRGVLLSGVSKLVLIKLYPQPDTFAVRVDTVMCNLSTQIARSQRGANLNATAYWTVTGGHTTLTGPLTNDSVTVSSNSAGTDTIYFHIVQLGDTNVISRTIRVSTTTTPPHSVIAGGNSVCVAATDTLTLTTGVGGGTWTSLHTGIATVSGTGVVYGVSAGVDSIMYKVTTSCGSDSAYFQVAVTGLAAAPSILGSTRVCTGAPNNTITLTPATALPAGNTYVWRSVNPAVSTVDAVTGVVTAVSAGNNFIRYVVTNSCSSDSSSKGDTVTANPTNGAITGATPMCIGVGASQTFTETGATNFTSFAWSSSSANATVNASTGVVTGVAAGPATISYAINGCVTLYDTFHVDVQAAQTAGNISGATRICIGAPQTLSAAAPATGTFAWHSMSPSIATVTNTGMVTGVTPGNVNIHYVITNACGSDSTSYTDTIGNVPVSGVITGSVGNNMCNGSSQTLTSSTTNIYNSTWSSSAPTVVGVATSGSVTAVANALSAGVNTTITATLYGCAATPITNVYTINVQNPQTAGSISGATRICIGTPQTLSAAAPATGTFTWHSMSPAVATVTGSGMVTGVTPGIVDIHYVVTNACGSDSSSYTDTVGAVPTAGTITGTLGNNMCNGTSQTLSNTTSTGIIYATWSTSAPTVASITSSTSTTAGVAAVGTTNAVITQTLYGCSTLTNTYNITVNAAPSVGTISGPTRQCLGAGGAIALTHTGPVSGIWTRYSSAISLTGAVPGSVTVTGNTVGVDTVYYTVSAPGCPDSVTKHIDTVQANVVVGPITSSAGVGSDTICVGSSSLTFNDTSTVGVWSSGSPLIATVASGVAVGPITIYGVSGGTATISYTVNSGCGAPVSQIRTVFVRDTAFAGFISGTTPICNGVPTGFTASGNAGGTWSSSNSLVAGVDAAGTVTGSLSPALPGADPSASVTIRYTVTNACNTNTASYNVIVREQPNPNAITTTGAPTTLDSLCIGSSLQQTARPNSSTAPAAGLTSVWSFSNTRATIGSTGVVPATITGAAAGFDTLKYTVFNTCGTANVTRVIKIKDLPPAGTVVAPSFVCYPVADFQLYDTLANGDTVTDGTWSVLTGSSIFVFTDGTATVPGPDFSATTVVSSRTGFCGTVTATKVISVVQGPVAGVTTGNATPCVGSNDTLSNTNYPFGDYWATSNPAVATVNAAGIVTGIIAGTANIYYVDTNACGAAADTFAITVGGLSPTGYIFGQDTSCIGGTAQLFDTVSAAAGGVWSVVSGSAATIDASGLVTGLNAGASVIAYTTTNGCGPNDTTFTFRVFKAPRLISPLVATSCDSVLFTYPANADSLGATYAWTRDSVTGLANIPNLGVGNAAEYLDDTVNTIVTATYIYTSTFHGCSANDTVKVAVSPTPHLISPLFDTVCSGSQFLYVDVESTTPANANWIRPVATNISNAAGAGVHGIDEVLTYTGPATSGGTVLYNYTIGYPGCPTHIETLTVAVNPTPAVPQITTHSPSEVCSMTMDQNFGSATPPPAGVNYTWFATGAQVWATGSTRQYSLVNFTAPGNAVVYLLATIPGLNCPAKDSFPVNVTNSVSDRPEVIYFNGDFICLANDQDTYQWGYDNRSTLDSELFAGETNQNYTVASPDFTGKYYFVITTHNGCMQKSYYNAPTGVANVTGSMGEMKVFPNPADQFVNVEINNTPGGKYKVEVVNLLGQTLNAQDLVNNKTTIGVSDLASGVYFINCYRDGVKFASAKFVKN